MYIKVCGLKSPADVAVAIEAGVTPLVLFMLSRSPRHLMQAAAGAVISPAAGAVDTVLAVASTPGWRGRGFRGGDCARSPSYTTLHWRGCGARGPPFSLAWRATSLGSTTDLRVGAYGEERLFLDAPNAGSGQR